MGPKKGAALSEVSMGTRSDKQTATGQLGVLRNLLLIMVSPRMTVLLKTVLL